MSGKVNSVSAFVLIYKSFSFPLILLALRSWQMHVALLKK